jgi:8-oxo-dGTP diphosphatase
MKEATLVLLSKGIPPDELLLGYKKVGFGQGKYTGFGGKVEPGETIQDSARREMLEETGITLNLEDLNYAAFLVFSFPNKPEWSQVVHVFTVNSDSKIPFESREMIPKWFPIEDIPYDQMWDDGRYWLPKILEGRSFKASFIFQEDNATVKSIEYSLCE